MVFTSASNFGYFVVSMVPSIPIGVFYAMVLGLGAGVAIGYLTEYFTSQDYSPTRELAESSKTGAATNMSAGIA